MCDTLSTLASSMLSVHGAQCWPTLMPKLFEWAQVCAACRSSMVVSGVCRELLPRVRLRSLSSESLHWGWAGEPLCIAQLCVLSITQICVWQLNND